MLHRGALTEKRKRKKSTGKNRGSTVLFYETMINLTRIFNINRTNHVTLFCLSYHSHLEGADIEGSDFPVTADVIDEFDQPMKPEHPRDHQHKDHKCIV